MRVFKTKRFTCYAKRAGIDVETLERAESGFIAADLGGGKITQSIADGILQEVKDV